MVDIGRGEDSAQKGMPFTLLYLHLHGEDPLDVRLCLLV